MSRPFRIVDSVITSGSLGGSRDAAGVRVEVVSVGLRVILLVKSYALMLLNQVINFNHRYLPFLIVLQND